MKILMVVLIIMLTPSISFADKDKRLYPITSTVGVSVAQGADQVDDFGPSGSDVMHTISPRFHISVKPHSADAIVQLQCTSWDSTLAVPALTAETENVNSGVAIPFGAPFVFTYDMAYNDGLCNIVSTSGGTQL